MKGTATAFALGLAVPAEAQTVPPAPADPAAELIGTVPPAAQNVDPIVGIMANYRDKIAVVRPCPTGADAEIVVCGHRSERERQRLPLPEEATDDNWNGFVRGELPRASTRTMKVGGCGMVQGGRPCAADTNNVLTAAGFLLKLLKKVTNPDADVEPPPNIPDRFRGVGR